MSNRTFQLSASEALDQMDWQGRQGSSFSDACDQEAAVNDLWLEAKNHTDDVGEQTWLVVHCVLAGRSAEWLKAQPIVCDPETGERRLPGRPIGEPQGTT